jgi:hypothetical protein
MDKSVIAFINDRSLDPHDLIAKRSIRAYIGLSALSQNADDRGDMQGLAEVARGISCAVSAFACINTEKRYNFAGHVHPQVDGLTEALLDLHKPADKAEGLLHQAEGVLRSLRDILTPICAVHSPGPKMILRGDHCRAAIAGLVPVNDN